MQRGERLIELVDHWRRGYCVRYLLLRRGRCLLLLLLEVVDALVLVSFGLLLLLRSSAHALPATYAPPPTTAARISGRRRLNLNAS